MNKPLKKKSARQKSRELAVQALYQWQLSQASQDKVIEEFLSNHDFSEVDKKYWRELVCQSIEKQEELHLVMQPFLSRAVNEITPVELAVLSVAFYEFTYRMDVPFRVVINEAIDLTKCFGASDSHRFINGVLDAAAKKLRETEVSMARKARN